MEKIKDMIYRQDAIDALDEIESEVADGDGFQYEKWRKYFCEIPSARQDHIADGGKMDCISRQAAIEDIKTWVAVDDRERRLQIDVIEWLKEFPSAQLKHDENPCKEQGDSDKFGVKTSETCEDCISRQAAIDAMANTLWHYPNECYRNLSEYEFAKGLAELGLKSVPPAQPDRPSGEWVRISNDWIDGDCGARYFPIQCSVCGYSTYDDNVINFCPNCGSDNRG